MQYLADIPLKDPTKDRFQRYPFAQSIAKSILNRTDESPLIIGINGSWGEGKSTVLDFIDGILSDKPKITVVRFNPWRYDTEEILFKQFIETLAAAIRSKEPQPETKFGRLWQRYFKKRKRLVTISEKAFTGMANLGKGVSYWIPGLGDLVSELGTKLSTVELEQIKSRFNDILQCSGQKLVVIIDDIDRLDDNEVHAVFRLVKLTADYLNTVYILSFDEKVIAKVVGQKHTAITGTGESFLEKIIQVPLKLPPAQPSDLQKFCLETIADILKSKSLSFNEHQERQFAERLLIGLLPMIKTPRMVIRYANSVNYSLDMLKGEVNLVDLLTIEAIKVFQHELYEFIRDHKDLFTENYRNPYDRQEKPARIQRANDFLVPRLKGAYEHESQTKALLVDLFPYLKEVFENTVNPIELVNDQMTEQRIGSAIYFDRYFSMAVLKNQIPDQELQQLLSYQLTDESENQARATWSRLLNINANELLTKLLSTMGALSYDQSLLIITMVRETTASLSFKGTLGMIDSEAGKASILVIHLLRRFRDHPNIKEVLKTFIERNSSLEFVGRFTYFLYPDKKEVDPFPDFKTINSILQYWVNENLKNYQGKPIFKGYSSNAYNVLKAFVDLGKRDEVQQYIMLHITAYPWSAVDLIKMFTPISPEGIFHDFNERSYEEMARIVDHGSFAQFLESAFATILLTKAEFGGGPQFKQTDENLFRQYVEVHRQVLGTTRRSK